MLPTIVGTVSEGLGMFPTIVGSIFECSADEIN